MRGRSMFVAILTIGWTHFGLRQKHILIQREPVLIGLSGQRKSTNLGGRQVRMAITKFLILCKNCDLTIISTINQSNIGSRLHHHRTAVVVHVA